MKLVCEFVGGVYGGWTIPVEEARKITEKRSMNWSEERNAGMCVPREELDDQPEFAGYLGPMWDGTRKNGTIGVLRYETQEVYDMLSR